MIRPNATVDVVPALPEALEPLRELAYNFWWAWNHDAIDLFRRMDRDLWESTDHNPILMMGQMRQSQLHELTNDRAFNIALERVYGEFKAYMESTSTWYYQNGGKAFDKPYIAYFSPEFGLTESLRSYSGGLGILSGDHIKAASDLGLPMVGVGIIYQEGYFHQYLNADGWQQESYPMNDFANLPLVLMRDADGQAVTVQVHYPGRDVTAQVWKVQVGRIPVILLDTNLSINNPEDRDVTDRLYGGDRDMRLRQEVLLGVGGMRALEALDMRPVVCHMNEGHSAFLGLERIRVMMKENDISFQEAKEITSVGNVFTTHTPVPAGIDRFSFDAIDAYFKHFYAQIGLNRDAFFNLGRERMPDGSELFSMAVLALNLSYLANGVAQLHGKISRRMWQWMFPHVDQHEVPIGAVTNGIHVPTWVSRDMATLFDRYLDPHWREDPVNEKHWESVERIPDGELWRTHERRRERLVAFARQRLRRQLESRGAPASELQLAEEVFNPDVLTIGFARRFATYKRATLLFRDPERLKKLLNDPDRPIQLIFAGKAHPHDNPGKDLIRTIVHFASQPDFRHAIVFLENYDMVIGRYLVQGVDVGLNTPRRPREASGTSGMKVVYNGGLNASILDGWWDEGYSRDVGWAIGAGEEYQDHHQQDDIESRALYNLLEQDLIPTFYRRGRDGLPREWIGKMKAALTTLTPYFNMQRTVREYMTDYYTLARDHYQGMISPDLSRGKAFAGWISKVYEQWPNVQVQNVEAPDNKKIWVEEEITIKATVALGELTPDDVRVELYYGPLDTDGNIAKGQAIQMDYTGEGNGEHYHFATSLAYDNSGARGMAVRVMPQHEDLINPIMTNLIHWANP